MKDLAYLLKELSVDFSDISSPLRQVIVNTHSPLLVRKVFELRKIGAVSILLSQLVAHISGNKQRFKMMVSKVIPVEQHEQPSFPFTEEERRLTVSELYDYLQTSDAEKHPEPAEL